MTWKYEGNVSLVSYLSDTFYSLLIDLAETSKLHPGKISYPAGAVIIGVACVESYINELIFMTSSFGQDEDENKRIRQRLEKLGTDVIKKLKLLRTMAGKAGAISDNLLDEFRLLYGFRGFLVHYEVQLEKPNDPDYTSRLRALERRLLKNQRPQGNVSFDRMLTAEFAKWVKTLVFDLLNALYRAGYEPPRPRWLRLFDPGRFRSKS